MKGTTALTTEDAWQIELTAEETTQAIGKLRGDCLHHR
jgi:hypothetical protein